MPTHTNIKTARDYHTMMVDWPEESQADLLISTSDLLLNVVMTREDFDLIQSPLTESALVQLFALLTPQKLASIFRADNSPEIDNEKLLLEKFEKPKPASRTSQTLPRSFFSNIPAAKAEVKSSLEITVRS